MDFTELRGLIAESKLLSEAEKTYWSANLERMRPDQLERLEGILARAKRIPWNEQVEKYLNLITSSTSNFFANKATS